MRYKTCATLTEKTPKKLDNLIKKTLKQSDFVEIRFDFLKPEKIPQVLELSKSRLKKSVCTLRPVSEGGKFSGTEKERISILKLIAEYNPFLLDIEYNTLKKNSDLLRYIRKTKTNILVSWHDFSRTPNFPFLKNRFKQMRKFSEFVKIVTTAKKVDDSTRLLSLYSGKIDSKLIAFSMGDYGRFSRILCLFLGSPYIYVSLGRPAAPGQFSLKQISKILAKRNGS